jgi:hypothetical protein
MGQVGTTRDGLWLVTCARNIGYALISCDFGIGQWVRDYASDGRPERNLSIFHFFVVL